MKKCFFSNTGGFTLLELMLYTALMGTIILVLTSLQVLLLQAQEKNWAIREVEEQGIQIMNILTQTIRNAEQVTNPTPGNTLSALTLDVSAPALDPTLFDVSNNILRIQEGAALPIDLNNSQVRISNLNFQNVARPDTPDSIRISFSLSFFNPAGLSALDYSKTFYGTASLY